jgi:hypothetical protein
MAGTAAGARKAWKTRRQSVPERRRNAMVSRDRALMLAGARESSGGFVHGLNINAQNIDEEYVQALKNLSDRVAVYDRMANDPKINGTLRATRLPIISNSRWKVEGGDSEAHDLVAANLLRDGPKELWCETSWQHRLSEMLESLKYGFALFGKTMEIVDGKAIYRRLTYLHPRSLGGTQGPWEYDKSGERLVAIHRRYRKPDGSSVTDIRHPIEEIFPVVWGLTGDNWEGVAMIRSMYRAFTEKDLLAKIQMIHFLNVGVGIPMVSLGPNDGIKEAEALTSIGKDLRQGDKSRNFILKRHDQEVAFLTAQGGDLGTGEVLSQKNMEIVTGAGQEIMQSGQTDAGSRANASVQLSASLVQIDAVRAWIEDVINFGSGYLPGLVEELVDLNFDNVKEYPRIVGSRVSLTEQLDNLPLVTDAVQKGLITKTMSLENEARKRLGWPLITQEEFDKATQAPPISIGGRPGEADNSGESPDPRDDGDARRFGLSAEKKSPVAAVGGSLPMKNRVSWRWLKSNQDSTTALSSTPMP